MWSHRRSADLDDLIKVISKAITTKKVHVHLPGELKAEPPNGSLVAVGGIGGDLIPVVPVRCGAIRPVTCGCIVGVGVGA